MQNRQKFAWTLAGIFGLSLIGAGLAFVLLAGGSDSSGPKPAANNFERMAAELVRAVSNEDAQGYLSLLWPDPRPSAAQVRDTFKNTPDDVTGCDPTGAKFAMNELNGGVSLDMTFAHPCGRSGATAGCNVYFRRGEGEWWIYGWSCRIANTGTPIRS